MIKKMNECEGKMKEKKRNEWRNEREMEREEK
jgi:hypothetical protein